MDGYAVGDEDGMAYTTRNMKLSTGYIYVYTGTRRFPSMYVCVCMYVCSGCGIFLVLMAKEMENSVYRGPPPPFPENNKKGEKKEKENLRRIGCIRNSLP